MLPTWLIEANVEGLPSQALQEEVRRQGMDVHVVKSSLHAPPPGDILNAEHISFDACVVFTGTLPLMRYIQTHRRWVPGGWCTFPNLSCSTYYAYFGAYLVNRNYTMLPIAEAIRESNSIFSTYGREGSVFVRPDSVDKSFGGRVCDADSFARFLTPFARDPTSLIVVAEPRFIEREWRLFIANSRMVTGSQYRVAHKTQVGPEVPDEVQQFARDVLARVAWRPDPLFVMDVGETKDGLHIVELNSFSCSGQCACDLEAYVKTASEFAARAW